MLEGRKYLGMDFLTWLLAVGEARGNEFQLPRNDRVTVLFDNKILLTIDSEQVDYRGEITNLEGVRLALRQGMKILEGKLMLKKGDREWRFSLNARAFQIKSLKLPKARYMDPAELWYDRMGYVVELCDIVDELYGQFIAVRMGDGWENELSAIREWLSWE